MYALIVIYLLSSTPAEVHTSKKVFVFPDETSCVQAENYWLPYQQGKEDAEKSGTKVIMTCTPVEAAPETTTGT